MNFFEHQEKARRNTGVLVALFAAGTLSIVFLVVAVIGALAAASVNDGRGPFLPDLDWYIQNLDLVGTVALLTAGFIVVASLVRSATLSKGGSRIASQLGGTPVSPDTTDPLRKRLYNVIEEMAIASGVPVPDVYVLESENGINAFAAGHEPGDAAVAVTRGCLESLDRDELQGVIAHEFSHILNGDMRLNIRLVGVLFGLLALGLVGRIALRAARYGSFGRSKKGGGVAAVFAVGLTLFILGYVGVFFGRLIKAAVSRQREFLADASAVQFTRDPRGIAGALKKIGGYGSGSRLTADSEEFSHMLFALGAPSLTSLLATHPPIAERIRAIDPNFDPAELAAARPPGGGAARGPEIAGFGGGEGASETAGVVKEAAQSAVPDSVMASVGRPDAAHMAYAGELRRSIPERLYAAAHSPDGAIVLILALLLDRKERVRTAQLGIVNARLGGDYRDAVMALHELAAPLGPQYRLPLLDLSFPSLKNRPPPQLQMLDDIAQRLIAADNEIEPFEYALTQVLRVHMGGGPAAVSGRMKTGEAVATLLTVLAGAGHDDDRLAEQAYRKGAQALFSPRHPAPAFERLSDWTALLDTALHRLGRLPPRQKGSVVRAMVSTIEKDGQTSVAEAELLRAICAALGVPVPPLLGSQERGD